ncbi:protein of unknown function [Magnetospirillum sp. XM-1]|nr:protein of unknown function [Magnetospirillum sp. XM-1]
MTTDLFLHKNPYEWGEECAKHRFPLW